MNANADPEDRPSAGESAAADGNISFDAFAADLTPAVEQDVFADLEPGSDAQGAAENGAESDSAALPATGPPARELEFLAELAKVSARRAQAEIDIEVRSKAERAAAEQAYEQAQQELATWLDTEAGQIVEEHTALRGAAKARLERDNAAADAEFAKLEQKIATDFDAIRKEALRLRDEANRESDARYDEQKAVAPRKLADFEQQLDAWKARIAADRDQAVKLLKRWRQKSPAVRPDVPSPITVTGDLAVRMQARVDFVAHNLAELARSTSPKLAISWVLRIFWLVAVLAGAAAATFLGPGPIVGGAILGGGLVLAIGGQLMLASMARGQVKELYPPLCAAAREVEEMVAGAMEKARTQTAAAQTKLIERREAAQTAAEQKYQARVAQIDAKRDLKLKAPTEAYESRGTQITARHTRDLKQAAETRDKRETERRRRQEGGAGELAERFRQQCDELDKRRAGQWQALVDQWQSTLGKLQAQADQIRTRGGEPAGGDWLNAWSHWAGKSWSPAAAVPPALRFGQFHVRMDQIAAGVPQHAELARITPAGFWLPAVVPFPERPSILFKARGSGRGLAVEAMQALMLRLLVTIPSSKLRFTIFDPVGLGENFAAFMHLADFNEALVSNRIWTEAKHIEERLTDLSEHMENVIQKYLRNEFQSIEQYNRDAGEIAEPFRFLVIANYPAAFSEAAHRRLMSIAASGARCGVYTLIMADMQVPLPTGFSIGDIEQHGTTLHWNHGRYLWKDPKFRNFELTLDSPPPPAEVTEMLQVAGRLALEAGKVEVPFEAIAPPIPEQWTSSAARGIDVPLGRAGASRLQSMKLGKGTSQHVIIGGKTGSGKSTLLHALITNIALRYSPDEVELYLIDFKQGVEFKTYVTHHLPHARIVAIESDREFGVSVLGRLDGEIKKRADRFRDLGVQDLGGYRQADPVNPLPRILMIVDEFQEFFTEDDKIAQDAALLLDRLVRQGRAFGIHVLLGSQTLAGTFTLARSTLGQMAVRIALQCSEADAHLILSDENSAARLLTRPGEAIYNDSNGMIEGNHPFQVVWLPDERREIFLDRVNDMVASRAFPSKPQVVFEGNVPADPANNKALAALLEAGRPARSPEAAHVWLGDAVAIKDPTAITFRAQSGSNLLIVGQNEEAGLGIMAAAMISLSAQHPAADAGGIRFYIFDGSAPGSPQAAALATLPGVIPGLTVVGARELPAAVNEVAVELERRQKTTPAELPPIFVVVYGVQKLRELRKPEDDFGFSRGSENQPPNPGKQYAAILRDGPAWGIHSIVWCDGVNNLNRTWDRQALRELEMRVVFQMSSNDSSTIIDSPLAGRLGKNRGLFHSEEQGILEKFRPYRWPGEDWLAWVRERLGGTGLGANGHAESVAAGAAAPEAASELPAAVPEAAPELPAAVPEAAPELPAAE